jgi:hypothetical protein
VYTVARGGPIGVRRILAAAAVGLIGVLVAATPAAAAAVNIYDASHVLDVTRVHDEAATLPDPVDIYTSTKFADDNAAFDREAQSKAAAQTVIVIAINIQSHHLPSAPAPSRGSRKTPRRRPDRPSPTDLLDAQVVRHEERFVPAVHPRRRRRTRRARDPGRGSLRSWLYTVATRTCLDTAETRG